MPEISIDFNAKNDAKIAVIGCGGGGGNAINTMIDGGLQYVSFIAVNTDSQALTNNKASIKLQIGQKTRKGLGCGAQPQCGFSSAEEDEEKIRELIEGHDMVFIAAGLGGGTGTGSAPVVARIAKDMGILTVAVVTKPFLFEGQRKIKVANEWAEELRKYVDSLIVISNQKIVETAGNISFIEGFKKADSVLMSAVAGIANAITDAGMINIDFADIKTILAESGQALIGVGYGSGENKVMEAVKQAIENPLVENLTIQGAGAILVNFTIGPNTTTGEISEATNYITKNAQEEAQVIFGVVLDYDLNTDAKVTIVATKFNELSEKIKVNLSNDKSTMKSTDNSHNEVKKEQPPVLKPSLKVEFHPETKTIDVSNENANSTAVFSRNDDNLDIPTWIRKKRNNIK